MTKSISYADAGVSIDNANIAVAKIREYARSTFNERTLTEIGSFGGMFAGDVSRIWPSRFWSLRLTVSGQS